MNLYYEMLRAKMIQKSLGTRRAAGYLRNRSWTLEAALMILTRRTK